MDEFAPYLKINGCFVVRNVTPDRQKTIKIFNYPILYMQTRDLLQIPGVAEQDIRASLLKGELQHKIRARDIVIECSDIDLLQFNPAQKAFLQSAGVVNGLDVSGSAIPFIFKQNQILVGLIDGINKVFTVPVPDKFLNGNFNDNIFKIQVIHNGVVLNEDIDYQISESGGVGTGFDTITIISFTPAVQTTLTANYIVRV